MIHRMTTSAELIEKLGETLEAIPAVRVAIVYGSVASGTMRDESDVDLVDLGAVKGVLLKQILTKGRVVIKRDVGAFADLVKKMVYDQEDYMPYYHRALRERMERFVSGQGAD